MQPSPKPPPTMQPAMPPWALAGLIPAVWLGAFLFAAGFGQMFLVVDRAFRVPLSGGWTALGAFVVAGVVGAGAGLLLGRRWPDAAGAAGTGLMAVGQLVTALAPGFVMFAAGRAVAGFGAGAAAGAAAMVVPRLAPVFRVPMALAGGASAPVMALLGFEFSQLMLGFLSFRLVYLVPVLPALLVLAGIIVVAVLRLTRRPAGPPRVPAAGTGFTVPGA